MKKIENMIYDTLIFPTLMETLKFLIDFVASTSKDCWLYLAKR